MHPIFIYSNKLNYMLFTKNSQTSLWLHVVYCLINILPSAMSTIFFIPTIFLTPTLNVIYLQKPFPFPDRNILFLFLPQTLIHVSNILLSILPHKYVCIYLSSVLTWILFEARCLQNSFAGSSPLLKQCMMYS